MIVFTGAWAWIAGAAQPAADAETEPPDAAAVELVDDPADQAEEDPDADPEPADTGAPEAPAAPVEAAEPELPARPMGRPTFLAGDRIEIEPLSGDVFATARVLRVTGELADNAYLLGQTVEIREAVRGDTLLMGQSVRIAAPVLGDVYAVGEEVRLEAPVYGNVYTAGNRVSFASEVHGFVEASAREIDLGGTLHKDTSLQFATVKVAEGARIRGDLNYVAPRPREGFETVADGDVRFKLGDFDVSVDPSDPLALLQDVLWGLVGILRNYIGLLAVGGTLLAFASPFVRGPARVAAEQPIMSAALGFVAFLVTPVAASIAILLFVTIPLGVIALALYGVGLYIVQLFTASALGHAMNERFFPSLGTSDFAALATGLVPLAVLSAIPQFVGTIVWLLASFVGFGALWLHWRDEARDRRRSKKG